MTNIDQDESRYDKLPEIIELKKERPFLADIIKKEINKDIINKFSFSGDKKKAKIKTKTNKSVVKEQYPKSITLYANQRTNKFTLNLLNSSNKMGKTPKRKSKNHLAEFMKYAPKYFKGNSIYNKNIFDLSKGNYENYSEEGKKSPCNNNQISNKTNTSTLISDKKDLTEIKTNFDSKDKIIQKKEIKNDFEKTKKRPCNNGGDDFDFKRAKKYQSLHNTKSSFCDLPSNIYNFIEKNDILCDEEENISQENMNINKSNRNTSDNEPIRHTNNNKHKQNENLCFPELLPQGSKIENKFMFKRPSDDQNLEIFHQRISQTNNDIITHPNKISKNADFLLSKPVDYCINNNMEQEKKKVDIEKRHQLNNQQNYSKPIVESIFGPLSENSYDNSKFPLVESFLLDQFKVVSFIHNCCLRLPPPDYFRTNGYNFSKSSLINFQRAAIFTVPRTFNDFDSTVAKLKRGVEYIKILNDERNDHRLVLNILNAHWMQRLSS